MSAHKKTPQKKKPRRITASIELHEDFTAALAAIESGGNVFVTGKAGTGKSTLLTHLLSTLSKSARSHSAVLAPTGVAAVNVGGQTIHSFFGFQPSVTVYELETSKKKPRDPKLYKSLELIIIDEISMVRADLFDCIDVFLRAHGPKKGVPLGGVQLVVFGDLYQLPPVVTREERELFSSHYKSPYFFDAHVFPSLEVTIVELTKVYRQRDESFVSVLNAIRNRSATPEDLERLNERVAEEEPEGGYVYLTTTNSAAAAINEARLTELSDNPLLYMGEREGNFERGALPAPEALLLAPGAQVMLTANDPQGRYVNGTMGTVVAIEEGEPDGVVVALEGGGEVTLEPYTWSMFRFAYDANAQGITPERAGTYTQYPLTLAWAITIHKSQGKTFNKVVVDLGHGSFAHGQTYVALSRATSLEGIVLTKPIAMRHILLDWRVVQFLTEFRYAQAAMHMSTDKKAVLLRHAAASGTALSIRYLKANDTESTRTIVPLEVGIMSYGGKEFLGVRANDDKSGEERVFRVDRILEINPHP